MRRFLILLPLLFPCAILAQLDTNAAEDVSPEMQARVEEHSVSKATWRSVMLPGWGQLYNKKYWKAPIVWAGMGTTIGFAIYHHQNYIEFRDAFNIRIDDDPNTSDNYEGIYTDNQLITIQTTYRRWRDLSIILAVGVYALNILDAYIDAHLYYFDISDDLSMNLKPILMNDPFASGMGSPGISLQLHWP